MQVIGDLLGRITEAEISTCSVTARGQVTSGQQTVLGVASKAVRVAGTNCTEVPLACPYI